MDNVQNIIEIAKQSLSRDGWNISGNFGTTFMINKSDKHFRFIVPINADQEYFDAIPDTLTEMTKVHKL